MTHFRYDPIDIVLPGGVAMITLVRLPPMVTEPQGVGVELRLRRPWDTEAPEQPDAALSIRVGDHTFTIHGYQSIF